MKILVDGMGGDYAPFEIVKGTVMAAPYVDGTVSILGPKELIDECLRKEHWKGNNIEVVDCREVITNDDSPAMSIRKKKDSTIVRAMNMMKEGDGDVFISGGSTGALLSGGLFILGRIDGIKRPAIAAFFPKIGKSEATLLLDCGANVDCKPEYLLQNGIMGSIYIKNVKGIPNPNVKLLNIGAEEAKGDELHKEAYKLLADSNINFTGNIEGRDVCQGPCDVVVCDGFSGNIFLKSSEGALLSLAQRVKDLLMDGNLSKIGALLIYDKIKLIKEEFNYEKEGGAPILGLKKPVLKIHGNANANTVNYAILMAIPYIERDVTGMIEKAINDGME